MDFTRGLFFHLVYVYCSCGVGGKGPSSPWHLELQLLGLWMTDPQNHGITLAHAHWKGHAHVQALEWGVVLGSGFEFQGCHYPQYSTVGSPGSLAVWQSRVCTLV